ncbi:MAG: LPS assembly lipoprotein LptE [Bacteroidia bacterium]|nr:LPS assembly lipoprotein LptE [Bacteroidia bacterium]
MPQIFSEKLRDMVSRQTPLTLVAKNGDIEFEGSITDFQLSPVSVQAGDLVSKNRLTITVRVKYSVKTDEKMNYEENFTRFADFNGNTNFSQVQNELMNEISRQICEDIFNKSFNNW